MTTRVLITGGGGFVGAPVVRELVKRGYDVHAVDIVPHAGEGGVTWHVGDLLDADARRAVVAAVRPDWLLHLAWYVEHGKFWTAPENELWAEVSLALLRDVIGCGCTRAVFVGSCAEYDWNVIGTGLVREADPCRPTTAYGRAKHALHQAAAAEADKAGLSFAWARLFLLFGVGENPQRLLPSVALAVRDKRLLKLSSGRQVRDFNDTRDIASALVSLLAANSVTGAVNVASGVGISVRDIALLTARLVGGAPELLEFGALPDRPEPPFLVADVTRLRQEVGFTPLESLECRLSSAIAEYLR